MPNLLVLSNKRYHTDFRKYLMRAVERAGGSALHIYCWETIEIFRNNSELHVFTPDIAVDPVIEIIRAHLGTEPLIVLTGLGCNESGLATRLQRALRDVVTVYDVYDDLMYNSSGFELIQRSIQDAIWLSRCAETIVLDSGLLAKYPFAHHIDNASHLQPIPAVAQAAPDRAVYIGSIDDRVDFGWLAAVAARNIAIDIYGRIHPHGKTVERDLSALTARYVNVKFHGGYDNDDLWSILPNYRIGLLPYFTDHAMTRHVNPDKLYHYLNVGLEVIAAPIPQAVRYAAFVHLITTDGPWDAVLRAVGESPRRGGWSAEANSWDQRWRDLLQAVARRLERLQPSGRMPRPADVAWTDFR